VPKQQQQQQQRTAKASAGDSSPAAAAEELLAAENAVLRSEVERALASLSSRPEAAASAVVEAFEAKDAALRAELQRSEEAERAAAAAAAAEAKEGERAAPPPSPPTPAPAPAAVAATVVAEGVAASVHADGTILFSFDDASAAPSKSRSRAGALPARRASAAVAAAAPAAPAVLAAGASLRAGSGVGRGGGGGGGVVRALPPSAGAAGASPSPPSGAGGGGGAKKASAAAGGKKGGSSSGEKAPSSSPPSSSSSPSHTTRSSAAGGGGGGGGAGAPSAAAAAVAAPSPSPGKAAAATAVVSAPPPPPKKEPSVLDLAVAAAERALAAGDEDAFDAAVDRALSEISEGSSAGGEEAAAARAALAAAARAAAAAAAAAPPPPDRGDWVYFTLPRRPVAGGSVAVFYNLASATEGGAALRAAGGAPLRLHARCNGWSLPLVAAGPAHFPLPAAPAPAPDGSGNWHVAALDLPPEAFELDFVVEAARGGAGDAEAAAVAVDNASGGDFVVPLASEMTPSLWGELALERAASEAEARREAAREAEREAAVEAERQARRDDAARGRERASAAVAAAREARQLGVDSAMPLWTTSPKPLVAGGGGVLYFNAAESEAFKGRSGGKGLKRAPVLHLGSNRWELPRDVEFVRCDGPPEVVAASKASAAASSASSSSSSSSSSPSAAAPGDWWRAPLAPRAADGALSFVVRASFGGDNGSGEEEVVDNNGGRDFFVSVQPPAAFLRADGLAADDEAWAASLAPELELEQRRQREAAAARAAAAAAARAQARADAAAKAAAVRRRQQRHVLYTDPEPLRAGSKAVLKYNPGDTPLSGAERVFARVGFNRWSHPRGSGAAVEMERPGAGSGGHFSLEVEVPRSAFSLQAVFSDGPGEGGAHARYDNRGGADYQLPVEGSPLAEPGLHVVHVAVEMAPIAKVGGLGDVVTALGRAVQEAGHLVEVIVPRFGFFSQSPLLGAMALDCEFDYGGTHVWVRFFLSFFSFLAALSFRFFVSLCLSPRLSSCVFSFR